MTARRAGELPLGESLGADGELVGLQVEVRAECDAVDAHRAAGRCAHRLRRRRDGLAAAPLRFSHETMTMSVVARLGDGTAAVFAKAPERIGALCAGSSLPADHEARAAAHALDGCYVLASRGAASSLASPTRRSGRSREERDLQLMGLLLFRNELKPDTAGAIGELKHGGVRPVMITGDNAHCAHYIARQCGLARPGGRLLLRHPQDRRGRRPGHRRRRRRRWDADGDAVEWSDLGRDAALERRRRSVPPRSRPCCSTPPAASAAAAAAAGSWRSGSRRRRRACWRPRHRQAAAAVAAAVAAAAAAAAAAAVWRRRRRWRRRRAGGARQRDAAALTRSAMRRLLMHTRIWARASPADKMLVVRMFQEEGLVVAMAGDGGNDCGALRAAHVGLALSEAEASLCAAFTTKTKSIGAVVELVRHGRAALATALANYKFLVVYGQLFSLLNLPLFYYGVDFSTPYLLIDSVAAPALTAAMAFGGRSAPRQERPTASCSARRPCGRCSPCWGSTRSSWRRSSA